MIRYHVIDTLTGVKYGDFGDSRVALAQAAKFDTENGTKPKQNRFIVRQVTETDSVQ